MNSPIMSFALCITISISLLANADDKIIFMGSEYPPYEYKEAGEVKGFSIDLLKAMQSLIKREDPVKILPWPRAYDAALNKENHVVFSTMRTPQRENLFKWVGPIYSHSTFLYRLKTRNELSINTLEDAKNHTIGTIKGFASENLLIAKGFVVGENLQRSRIELNAKKLLKERIDFIITKDIVLKYILKDTIYSNIKAIFHKELPLYLNQRAYFAFNINTDNNIINQYQAALDSLVKSGDYQIIYSKYVD